MILLNTYFKMEESFNRQMLFDILKERLKQTGVKDEYTGSDKKLKSSSIFDYEKVEKLPAEYACRFKIEFDGDKILLGKDVYVCQYDSKLLIQHKTITDKDTNIEARYVTQYAFDEKAHILSVKKEVTLASDLGRDVSVTIPSILKSLFWNEFVSDDNGLMWDDKPIILKKKDAELAADILNGNVIPSSPVIYISPTENGIYDVDYASIASEFIGQAHIVVESTPLVTDLIKKSGVVAYPFGNDYKNCRAALYYGGKQQNVDTKCTMDFVDSVHAALSEVRVPGDYDFIKLRQNYLVSQLGNSDGELAKIFDSIIQDKDIEIETLKKQIESLKLESYQASAKVDVMQNRIQKQLDSAVSIAFEGKEKDLYPDERKDIILKILQKEYDAMKDDATLSRCRKFDVIKDVLEHNFPSGTDTKLICLIKGAFNDGSLSKEGIGRLQSAGFVVVKDGRQSHYEFVFADDDRYRGTFSSTTSDKARASKNFISDYTNTLFGY